MSTDSKDGESESQSLAIDALPMPPRELHEVSSQTSTSRQNEEPVNEPTSTEQLHHPSEPLSNIPEPPTDWNFNIFLNKIAESLTTEDLVSMKWFFEGEGGLGKGVLETMKTPTDLFRIMRTRGYISRDNLLYLQGILYHIGRKDLIQEGIDYAKTLGNVLHFYAPTFLPENGYKYVKFHVDGKNFENYSRDDIENLRRKVSALLFVPPQFVFVAGIEPSSSLVITLMIPEIYVPMLREMLEAGDVLTDLRGTGVDIIEINGEKSFGIKSTGDNDNDESEQKLKLVNVYEQLQQTKERLDDSEIKCIDLYRKIDDMQKTIKETEDNLNQMENEVHVLKRLLSMSDNRMQPASLKELSSLTEFTDSLHDISKVNVDKKIVRRMLVSTVNYVSTWVQGSYRLREQSLILSLQNMQLQLDPLRNEIQRLRFLDSLKNPGQQILIDQRISLKPLGIQMSAHISSKLSKKEQDKLRGKYKWTPNGEIERFMEQDPNFLLAGLFYKEVSIKQIDIPFDTFIAQCLSEVNRDDLKEFLDPRYYQNPQSPGNVAGAKEKSESAQRQNLYPQQQPKKQQAQPQGQQQEQGQHQEQQEQASLIKQMAIQVNEMYTMLQTTKQKMFESKDEGFFNQIFQQHQSI